MVADASSLQPATESSGGLVTAFRAVVSAVAIAIVVMAALAGQGWFNGRLNLIRVHGVLGNIAFLGALALVLLGFLLWRRTGAAMVFGFSLLLALLMTAQMGLGYLGRQQAHAAATHIPNAILVTMVLSVLLTLAWVPRGSRPNR